MASSGRRPSRALEGDDIGTIFGELEIPVDLVNKPGRGYSLVLRNG